MKTNNILKTCDTFTQLIKRKHEFLYYLFAHTCIKKTSFILQTSLFKKNIGFDTYIA